MEQTLGKRIVANRKRLGLTQDQLAEKLGVTAQAVSKWENDQSCPDITILPKLAEIFGTSTDALLGVVPEPEVHEASVVQKDNEDPGSDPKSGGWEFKYDNSRRAGISFAVLVLLVGGLYLVSSLLKLDVIFWDISWPCALVVFSLSGLSRGRISFLRLGCALFGGFFLVNCFIPVPIRLDSGVILAILLLLFGVSLLADALRKPKKPMFEFTYNGETHRGSPGHSFEIDDDTFEFCASFGEQQQYISMPLLTYGSINTSFGDNTVDLSGVLKTGENCSIEANTSFGELTIRVPRRFHVRCSSNASFACVETEGHPDPEPQGFIILEANASFGQITVKYI